MILYLIRHGKTYCNEENLYCGFSDVSLSELGKREILDRKENMYYPECKMKFITGLKRTEETIKLIYGENTKFKLLEEFKEYNFGEFELKSYEELKEDKDYINWILDKTDKVSSRGGETRRDFKNRLKEGLNLLIKKVEDLNLEEALVVCHGGSISSLLLELLDEDDFYKYHLSCGEGYKIELHKENDKITVKQLEKL